MYIQRMLLTLLSLAQSVRLYAREHFFWIPGQDDKFYIRPEGYLEAFYFSAARSSYVLLLANLTI